MNNHSTGDISQCVIVSRAYVWVLGGSVKVLKANCVGAAPFPRIVQGQSSSVVLGPI